MACLSLTALPRACGAGGIVAGVQKVWMIAYNDLDDSAGEPYTLAVNGMIATILLDTDKFFVEVGLLNSTAGLNETLTKNNQTGTSFMTQTFTLVLSDLTVENRTFVTNIINQPVAVIIKSRTGKYFAAGISGQLELATMESGTGIAEGDLTGYSLTFTGFDGNLIRQVDATIVADLYTPAG